MEVYRILIIRKKWLMIAIFLLLLLLGGILYIKSELQPPDTGNRTIILEIPKGSTTYTISHILRDKGLIKNAAVFRWWVYMRGDYGKLQAGMYEMKQGMSVDGILDILTKGEAKDNTVRFTVPEGFTLEQIADLLAKKGLANKETFIRVADSDSFDVPFLKEIPKTAGVKHRLEGYLFPDTYEIYKGTSEHEIIELMLKNFDTRLTPEMRAEIGKRGMTIPQVVTVASLVEREARVPKERPVIAGVIYNRLHSQPPMMLQVDATVQYVLGHKDELSLQDLQIDSPYNTYKHFGLPPGPIASPGLDSLRAAIEPDHNDYLFYVTKKDGSGEHYFAKTYDEQLQNEKRSEQNEQNVSARK
ncbi:aminodeoxychorismate lyase [Collibacillus ludicampi]|uniref:Endolytic murein transglycosylase n=1 Tax=Collibacillus ludicampi TaxID=2771369 RepID=A0AAV4LA60_9BACL|nr:aminodeoxychorismate lyase [Collibacillus ludicampi]